MKSVLNPPGGWAQDEGQDFLSNNKLDCVDIVGLHGASGGGCASLFLAHGGRLAVWPDNWGDAAKSPAFQQAYIRSHLADVAANIKKPFILEEVRWGGSFALARRSRCSTVWKGHRGHGPEYPQQLLYLCLSGG